MVEDYELDNGVVYRTKTEGHRMLYVPTEMENNIIRLIHEKLAHQNVDKCYEKVREH